MSTTNGGLNIVKNGLVLYLDATNNKSYVSGSTKWNDLSGNNNNNATLTNGPTYSSGNAGSILFDGVDDYGTILNSPSLNMNANNITVMSVFNSNINTGYRPLAAKMKSDYSAGWELANSGGTLRATFNPSVSNNNNVYGGTINTGSWCLGTVTCDNTTMTLYLNTTVTSTSPLTLSPNINSSENLLIGIRSPGSQYFGGNIPTLLIYNRALSAIEIQQNWNTIKSRFGL
jgi:hypothetical protein